MALKDLINELKQGAMPFVRGVGTGATLGAIKYPGAALMVLIDQIRAENPRLTFKEALELVNEQQSVDRAEAPIASLAGETLGSLAPGVGAARVATTLPAALGAGAAQGAVAGFNERQELGDAAFGAGLGSLGVLGGRAVDAGRAAATRAALRTAGAQRVDETTAAIIARQEQLATPGIGDRERKRLERSIRSLAQSRTEGEKLLKASELPEDILFQLATPFQKGGGPLGRSAKGDVLGTTRASIANQGGSDLASTLLGAGAGYGLGNLAGDEHAILGALVGGALGNKANKFNLKKVGIAGAALPRGAGAGAGSMAGTFGARQVPQQLEARELDALEAQYDVDELDALEAEYDKD